MNSNPVILDAPEPVLSTLEQDGSRRWLYPRVATGRFWHRRRAVAYALLGLFVLVPFLRIGGRPVLLLDVIHRRFTIFGQTFLPTDMRFLALALLTWIVSIFLFTAVFGRVWCGWACPQTVYLEYVFRPIERLFTGRTGRGGRPAGAVAGWRLALMYATYVLLCVHLANTFLAYFVPAETLNRWITSSPANHPAGFAIVVVVSAAMLFNFAWFREQTCIIACPYGRIQSVLLDRQSLIISYDSVRGEPRGHAPRPPVTLPVLKTLDAPSPATADAPPAPTHGDCVDCTLCVQVCPTGIDIRRGLQVECVACAQCVDACDAVMDKVGRPRGLIRYASQAQIAGERGRLVRPRVVIYSAIVAALLALLATLLASRAPADVTLLRNVGRPFVVLPDGAVENTLKVKVTNRTDVPQTYRVEAVDAPDVRVELSGGEPLAAAPGDSVTRPARVIAPAGRFVAGSFDVTLRVTSERQPGDAGEPARIDGRFRLLGPAGAPASAPTDTPHAREKTDGR